jgi:hypothetical protein
MTIALGTLVEISMVQAALARRKDITCGLDTALGETRCVIQRFPFLYTPYLVR